MKLFVVRFMLTWMITVPAMHSQTQKLSQVFPSETKSQSCMLSNDWKNDPIPCEHHTLYDSEPWILQLPVGHSVHSLNIQTCYMLCEPMFFLQSIPQYGNTYYLFFNIEMHKHYLKIIANEVAHHCRRKIMALQNVSLVQAPSGSQYMFKLS